MLRLSSCLFIIILVIGVIVKKAYVIADGMVFKTSALPTLYDKDDSILDELYTETAIQCTIHCLRNSCSGILIKTESQMTDIHCFRTSSHLGYNGTLSSTMYNQTCQRWDTQYPHSHINTADFMTEDTLSEAQNYCRDPDKTGNNWCFTTNPLMRWDNCDIMKCMTPQSNCRLYSKSGKPASFRSGYRYYQ